jgi:hypothetical protein
MYVYIFLLPFPNFILFLGKRNWQICFQFQCYMFLTFKIDFLIIFKRRELGREPTLDEVFLRTHTKKKDSSWVDERAKKTYVSVFMFHFV